MNYELDERILDACLEEMLGGRRPPDLSARILHTYKLGTCLKTAPSREPPPRVVVASVPRHRASPRHSPPSAWIGLWITLGILVCGTSLGLLALHWSGPSSGVPGPEGRVAEADVRPDVHRESAIGPSMVTADRDPLLSPGEAVEPPIFRAAPPLASGEPWRAGPTPAVARLEFAQVVGRIDARIRAGWQQNRLVPAPHASDVEWCRRLYQRVLGRLPSAVELAKFQSEASSDRRRQLAQQLCMAPEHRQEFASYWSHQWADVLVSPETSYGGFDRERLRRFLATAFRDGTSLSAIAAALLTAEGGSSDGAEQFLLAHYDRETVAITAHTGRVFLGKRLLCARCHDHPGDPQLSQQRFWELNAFFRQLALKKPAGAAQPRLVDVPDHRPSPKGPGDPSAVFFETPSGVMKAAYPAFFGASPLQPGGGGLDVDRRSMLAEYLVESRPLRLALVNRVWSMLCGFGFTAPVDDLGPHNPPSHPELLNDLADQLAAHNDDLPTLITWIVSSEAFGLAGQPASRQPADQPEQGSPAWFSRAYRAGKPARSLDERLLALQDRPRPNAPVAVINARLAPLESAPLTDAVAVPANADLAVDLATPPRVARQHHQGPDPLVRQLLESELPRASKLSHLFWILLQREPTDDQRSSIDRWLAAQPNESAAWLDLWWVFSGGL